MFTEQKNLNVIKYQKNCREKTWDLGFKSHITYIIDNQKLKTIRQRGKTYQISQIPEMSRSAGKIRYGLRPKFECGGWHLGLLRKKGGELINVVYLTKN